jgi:hypothetical protein
LKFKKLLGKKVKKKIREEKVQREDEEVRQPRKFLKFLNTIPSPAVEDSDDSYDKEEEEEEEEEEQQQQQEEEEQEQVKANKTRSLVSPGLLMLSIFPSHPPSIREILMRRHLCIARRRNIITFNVLRSNSLSYLLPVQSCGC